MKTRRLLTATAGTFLICGLGGAGLVHLQGRGARAMAAQMARGKALGMPGSPADLGIPLDDPAQNAAMLYKRLAGERAFQKAGELASSEIYPADAAAVRAFDVALQPVQANLSEFERATKLPVCRFNRRFDYTDRFSAVQSLMRSSSKLLATRARREASGGDPVKAMETLAVASRAAAHAGQDPDFIAKLVQASMERVVVRAAQEVLTDHGRKPEVRAAARRMIAALGPDIRIKDYIKGAWLEFRHLQSITDQEFEMELEAIEDASKSAGSSLFGISSSGKGDRLEQETNVARFLLDAYETLPEDPMDIEGTRRAVRKVQDDLDQAGSRALLAQQVARPDVDSLVTATTAKVKRHLLETLLDALEKPTPPPKLPLQGQAAIDPFSGKPYNYRASAEEIKIRLGSAWAVTQEGKMEVRGRDLVGG
ncbi:hypothetical protein EON81_16870, partial [bacterium]